MLEKCYGFFYLMQELKILSILFFTSFAGVIIGLGGTVYTTVQQQKIKAEKILPESKIAVPALTP